MKKIGDMMAEMGFRPDAPESVKEAFLKHLIHATTGILVETPTEKKEKEAQLAFDFIQDQEPRKKLPGAKVS